MGERRGEGIQKEEGETRTREGKEGEGWERGQQRYIKSKEK